MAAIACIIWLFLALRVTWVLCYLLWCAISYPFRRQPEPLPGDEGYHRDLWDRAERTRLTREEVARRVFALYPVKEVPRVRWPTSYGR